ncbi:hypothetical protein JCM3766R1_005450 [Sporobolomyces carnicolor]
MSALTLPSELIGYIADLVEQAPTPDDTDSNETTRTTGCALSLVCRSWTRIGQSLRWRRLSLQISAFPSLLRHLTAHPHLAPLIRVVYQFPVVETFPRVGASPRQLRMPSEDAWVDALVSVLSITRGIVSLTLADETVGAEQLPQLLQAASRLPLLQTLEIFGVAFVEWNDDCASAWLDGFPSIIDLCVNFEMEDLDSHALRQHDRPLKQARTIEHRWYLKNEEEEEAWASWFLSTLDPSALRECHIFDSVVCPATFLWLGRCDSLTELVIDTYPERWEQTVPELLLLLPKLQALRSLRIEDVYNCQREPSEVDFALEEVLASCPPNLSLICVSEICFRGGNALPKIDGIMWNEQDHLVGRGLVRKSGQEQKFWGLRSDRDGRWFRVATDDDHDGEEQDEEDGGDADERGDPDDAGADNFGNKVEGEEDENPEGSIETSRDAAGDDAQGAVRAQGEQRDGAVGGGK